MPAKYALLIVDGNPIDVINNEGGIGIDYNIDDDADFTKVVASKSNSLQLANTKNISDIFSHFGEIETKNSGQLEFKPAQFEVDGITILNGKAQLIKTTERYNPTKVEIGLWGDNGGWIISLRGKRLKDLPFDTFNLGGNTIKNSWAGSYDTGWKYAAVPINYGQWYDTAGQGISKDDIRPHFYVKYIIDMIFNSIGYKIQSSFFESSFFKKLLWVFSGDVNNANNLELDYGKSGTLPVTHVEFTIDNGNTVYNQLLHEEPVNIPGDYILNLSAFYDYFADTQLGLTPLWGLGIYLHDYNNNTTQILVEDVLTERPANPPGDTKDVAPATTIRLTEADLTKRIQFKVRWKHNPASGVGIPYDSDFYLTPTFLMQLENNYVTGQPIDMTKVINNDLQSEFLKGLTEMFNLKWLANEALKTVYCEPRDKDFCPYANYTGFYGRDKFNEYTGKRDLGKDFIVQGINIGDRYELKYKPDSSDFNIQKANDNTELDLYSAISQLTSNTDNAKTVTLENSFFSACYHIYDSKVSSNGGAYYMPCCWDSDKPDADTYPQQSFNIDNKIIYYQGLSDLYPFKFDGNNEDSAPLSYQVNYDNIDDPLTVNLSYSDQVGALVNTVMPGLARCFWLRLIATYRENKNVVCSIYFTPGDIANLNFRSLVKHKGDNYILQSVRGYNPYNDDSTEVNLIYDKSPEQSDLNSITHSQLKGFING